MHTIHGNISTSVAMRARHIARICHVLFKCCMTCQHHGSYSRSALVDAVRGRCVRAGNTSVSFSFFLLAEHMAVLSCVCCLLSPVYKQLPNVRNQTRLNSSRHNRRRKRRRRRHERKVKRAESCSVAQHNAAQRMAHSIDIDSASHHHTQVISACDAS